MTEKSWSLIFEIGEIESAVAAIVRVLDGTREIVEERELRRIGDEARAVAVLVELRLRDISRVLRGELDPRLLHSSHNAIDPDTEVTDLDVILPSRPAPTRRR